MDITKTKRIVFYVVLSAIVITYFFVRLPELEFTLIRGLTAPGDFTQDYIGAQQLLSGKSVYPSNFTEIYKNLFRESPKLKENKTVSNAHPPFVSMIMSPLGFLSFKNAAALWSLITIICMLFINLLLLRSENISLIYFPLLVLFTLAWQPFQSNLMWGQISILITLFVITGWFFYKKENEIMAGIFIALATMLKFYPGLLIVYFLIHKKYRAFKSSIISISVMLILTFIVTKYDFFYFILHIMPQNVKSSEANLLNLSINGFFIKVFMLSNYNFIMRISPFLRNLFLYVTIVALLFYLAINLKRYNYNNDLGFSLFIILSLLLSPLCWDHYLTLLLLPFVVLIKELKIKYNKSAIFIFMVALLLVSINAFIYVHGNIYLAHISIFYIYRITFYSAQFYGMVLLLYLNFRLIKNRPREKLS